MIPVLVVNRLNVSLRLMARAVRRSLIPGLWVGGVTLLVGADTAAGGAPSGSDRHLARQVLADTNLTEVLDRGRALLRTGLNAGSGYGEVWIRDLNTFIEVALQVNEPQPIRGALLTFCKFQGPEGDIVDGFIPKERANVNYQYRRSPSAPEFLAHKNTVETDQESSLIQAVRKYVDATSDRALLEVDVDGRTVRKRLEWAMDYLLKHRFSEKHGLIWGATTADWGDVQPEHDWGVELDQNSHRTLDIYDNAMFLIAIRDYLELVGDEASERPRWMKVEAGVRASVRRHLWDAGRGKFVPHVYLEGSPFPADFDEAAVWYHGGTAVAIEADLLSKAEVKAALEQMVANVKAAEASSIGLTVYPPYPAGSFKNPGMGPYSYQNGGDWCWFGGRMIRELIRYGLVEEAYRELEPMTSRVLRVGDFHEWWSRDNEPRGSGRFRGSAGVLGMAIQELQAWAREANR